MAFKILKKRWQKTAVITLLSLIFLVLILAIFINRYWSPILESKVKDAVLKSSDSLYKVDFTSAELHVLRGTIIINNITLKPDTAVYNGRKRRHLAPNNVVELQVKKLTLSHIHPFKLYFQHKMDIGQVFLEDPHLNISYQLNHKTDTVLKDHRTIWQKMQKSLHSIHIGKIALGDVKFRYEDYSGTKLEISELKELNLTATDLLIDSATQLDKNRLLYCRDIVGELNNYKGKTADGLYTYTLNNLKLSTLTSRLKITGFNLKPVKSEEFFSKSTSDKFTIRLDTIQLNNFDFLNYHKYRVLTASALSLRGGMFAVYNNPNKKPDKVTDKVITFPNDILHHLGTALKLDTIHIHGMDVAYSEFNNKSNQTGTIIFNNTSGRFLNVTTKPDELQKNNMSNVKLTTYFMHRGKLNVELNFNLNDEARSYSYKGHLAKIDLQALNSAIMPLAMVKIKTGTLNAFDFDVKANRYASKGRISLLYDNLFVTLLKADTGNDRLKKMTILSMFANLFILKHNNPDNAGSTPRAFYVNMKRPTPSPFFKTIWNTMLEGLKPCVGLDKKTVQATKARIDDAKSFKEQRMTKKALRQQRRAERRRKRAEKKQLEADKQ